MNLTSSRSPYRLHGHFIGNDICNEGTSNFSASDDGSATKTTRGRSGIKFAEFQKANPPSFEGTFDLDKAKEWIKAMEKVFSILACTDYQKVMFATYMLEANGEFWQNGVRRLLEESQADITCEMFKEAFYLRYFPASI